MARQRKTTRGEFDPAALISIPQLPPIDAGDAPSSPPGDVFAPLAAIAPPVDRHGAPPLFQHLKQLLTDSLTGDAAFTPEQREIEPLREKCRQGNPFPLIAAQWLFLVIPPGHPDARYFEGTPGDAENPCLRLDNWQRQIIAAYFNDSISEIFVKGNTKAGKGTSTSIAANLWYDVYPEAKIILTSQRFDHAIDVIFGEISKWRQKMKVPSPGRLTATGLSGSKQRYITVANPQSGEGFSGQHGPRTLFIFDEATSIPDGFYNDAQKQARKIAALANPRVLSGWFRASYPSKDPDTTQYVNGPFGLRLCVTVDGAQNLNVRERRLEKPLGPPGGILIGGREFRHNEPIPHEYFDQVRTLIPEQCDYGRFMGICQHPDPRHIAVFARGKFPEEDPEKQVILGSWLGRHEAAYDAANPPKVEAFGLDVARSMDGDATCLTAGGRTGLRAKHLWKFNDTMFHVNEVLRIAGQEYGIDLKQGRHPVTVDMDGLGAGVGDRLKELGVWVIEFRGNAGSQVDPKTYGNARAEAYATLGRRLDPNDRWGQEPWAMPIDENLREELTAPEKVYKADYLRFHITPKYTPAGGDENAMTIKKKLNRSPDTADSVVMMFVGVREIANWNEFFRHASRPLVSWPAPEPPRSPVTMKPPEPPPPNINEPDILTWLRRECGPTAAPDLREESQRVLEARDAHVAAARANGTYVEKPGVKPGAIESPAEKPAASAEPPWWARFVGDD